MSDTNKRVDAHHYYSRLKLRLLRRACVREQFDCPVSWASEACCGSEQQQMNVSEQQGSLSSTYDRNTNVPLSQSSLLGYWAGLINNVGVCGSVDVCQRITGEKSCGVSPSQRRLWTGDGHARSLPGSVGNLGATKRLAKRESKTARDRKGGIESEWWVNASPWRRDVLGYWQSTAEGQLTKKASMSHRRIVCVFRCHWHALKKQCKHTLWLPNDKDLQHRLPGNQSESSTGGSNLSFPAQHVTHFLYYSQNTWKSYYRTWTHKLNNCDSFQGLKLRFSFKLQQNPLN